MKREPIISNGKRVAWVTGAAGFIGGHVAQRLRHERWAVTSIDRLPKGGASAVHQVVGEVNVDTLDKALRASGAPDFVFHAAGTSSVGLSVQDPIGSRRDTVTATEVLLNFLLANAPHARVVFPSSAAVYGSAPDTLLSEGRAPAPVSPYGEHKLAAERACFAAAAAGLSIAILRLFSVYGPGLYKQLPWDLAQKLLASHGSVELFGTGAETRDFLHVSDVAALVVFLAGRRFPRPFILNGGTGIATRIDVFAALFAGLLGIRAAISFNGQSRPGDPKHYRADTGRLAAMGFMPQVSLTAGLRDYAAWIKEAKSESRA